MRLRKKTLLFCLLFFSISVFVLCGWIIFYCKKNVFYWDGETYQNKKESSYLKTIKLKKSNYFKDYFDLDEDGSSEEIDLIKKRIFVKKDGKIIWQSDELWSIENLIIADSNNDGKIEINFSLWKTSSYGRDLPFWLKENTKEWGNHFFVYGWINGKVSPVWCSSTLDSPIKEFKIGDVNRDGKNELIVLEGDYADSKYKLAKYLAVWSWGDWGFFNDYRSKEGRFYNLSILDLGKDKKIEVYEK